MRTRPDADPRNHEEGSAAVEFALVLPLVLVVLLALVQVGLIVRDRVHIATDVDHIIPLRDGGAPFERSNLQGLCHSHHSSKTAGEVLHR